MLYCIKITSADSSICLNKQLNLNQPVPTMFKLYKNPNLQTSETVYMTFQNFTGVVILQLKQYIVDCR